MTVNDRSRKAANAGRTNGNILDRSSRHTCAATRRTADALAPATASA